MTLQQEIQADESPTSNGVWEAVNCEAEWPTNLEVYYADMRYFSEHYPCVEPLVKLRRSG